MDWSTLRECRGSAFATWVALGSTYTAEQLGAAGYDALVIDLQHGAVTWEQLGGVIQAIDLNRVPSLVRVGGLDGVQIMRALDLGAAGVIVPMVSTAEEAAAVVDAMYYPPRGSRSFGKVRSYYSEPGVQPDPLCFVMIETAEGVRNLDAIAAVEGVDGLFVGPVDLGLALGLGVVLKVDDAVMAEIQRIAAACSRHGKICASASFDAAYSEALLGSGVQLIVQGSDIGFVRRGAGESVARFRAVQQAQAAAD